MPKVLIKWKSERDHNWRTDILNLTRLPAVGEYIAVGGIPEVGCLVRLVLHRSGSGHEAEVYGAVVELEEALDDVAEWDKGI